VPDPLFADPRLAALYDVLEADRSDLDAYAAIVDELAATTVLDVGCGTGTFVCMLAQRGIQVVGIDPAEASLERARRKPGAGSVRWIHGDAVTIPAFELDLATMTGNVAQVFLTDADWHTALHSIRQAVRAGGWVVFEVRDPAQRAWEKWTKEHTYRQVEVDGEGIVTTWTELLDVRGPLVSFRHVYSFTRDGSELRSDSTLRFRDRDEIAESLEAVGLDLRFVRDAPDRPGKELVFLAQRDAATLGGTERRS
jgi:SAM-dependent methyltransferase